MTSKDHDAAMRSACKRAAILISDFVNAESFGRCFECEAESVPQPFRQLLDHNCHMTVTMESFHGQQVSLEVLAVSDRAPNPEHGFGYSREIILRCNSVNSSFYRPEHKNLTAGLIVQYGIVGIALELLPQPVADSIRAKVAPLGRILIEAGLHRRVHDVGLLKIDPGPHLRQILAGQSSVRLPATYGRVATIDVDGHPVISLLEVVAGPCGK